MRRNKLDYGDENSTSVELDLSTLVSLENNSVYELPMVLVGTIIRTISIDYSMC